MTLCPRLPWTKQGDLSGWVGILDRLLADGGGSDVGRALDDEGFGWDGPARVLVEGGANEGEGWNVGDVPVDPLAGAGLCTSPAAPNLGPSCSRTDLLRGEDGMRRV